MPTEIVFIRRDLKMQIWQGMWRNQYNFYRCQNYCPFAFLSVLKKDKQCGNSLIKNTRKSRCVKKKNVPFQFYMINLQF